MKARNNSHVLTASHEHKRTRLIASLIIIASIINFVNCLIMLIISIWYNGSAPSQKPNFHNDTILPDTNGPGLPWWGILVAFCGNVSGPVMELMVRMELLHWEGRKHGGPASVGARVGGRAQHVRIEEAGDATTTSPERSNIDAIMRIGLILAWTIAVLGGYWAACIISLLGLILACAWQHSWETIDEIEWRRVRQHNLSQQNVDNEWHDNDGAGRVSRRVRRHNERIEQRRHRSAKKYVENEEEDEEQNSESDDSGQESNSESLSQTGATTAWDHEEDIPSDEPLLTNTPHTTLHDSHALLSSLPTFTTATPSFLKDFIRTNTFFYLVEFVSLTVAYFAFLRLSSLFMTSTLTDFGFSFRWYDISVVNATAGCAVLIYLLLVHKYIMQNLAENHSLIFATLLGFICIIPLPLLSYFARENGRRSYALWQFLIILIPLYHISITMGILAIRRKLGTSVHDHNQPIVTVIMFVLLCVGMTFGVLVGSSMYQLLKYFRKPQIVSFVVVALLHVVVVMFNVLRTAVECITPVESERAIIFFEDDLDDSDSDVGELFSRVNHNNVVGIEESVSSGTESGHDGDRIHEEGHMGTLESAEEVSGDEDGSKVVHSNRRQAMEEDEHHEEELTATPHNDEPSPPPQEQKDHDLLAFGDE